MTILDRNALRRNLIGVFALAGAILTLGSAAEARLRDPGQGGPISGGFFSGLPVRVQSPLARPSDAELTGIAGDNCHVLRQVVRDRMGGTMLRTVRVCE